MHFTQEDYIKIENWLHRNSVKDTEFQEALPFTGKEIVTVVQDGHNRKVNIQEFINQLYKHGVEDFLNVTNTYRANNITLKEAIRLIPAEARKEGQVITFLNTDGNWEIYQFIGKLNQWNNPTLWNNPFDWEKLIVDSILPDEEDLTKSAPDAKGNAYLSLKDRKYEPDKYSGLGRKILRRRVVEIEDPVYGIQEKNLLLQADFAEDNTVYVVRYDFTLNGQDITLPDNSYIEYEGGSISDGNIVEQEGGMSRIVLKKNTINGVNRLTQNMISKPNTIYEVRNVFDLGEKEITLPSNSIVEFNGGTINNGIIVLSSDNKMAGKNTIFNNIRILIKNSIKNINISNIKFIGNKVLNSTSKSSLVYGIFQSDYFEVHNINIEDCWFENYNGGISLKTTANCTISNNVFYKNGSVTTLVGVHDSEYDISLMGRDASPETYGEANNIIINNNRCYSSEVHRNIDCGELLSEDNVIIDNNICVCMDSANINKRAENFTKTQCILIGYSGYTEKRKTINVTNNICKDASWGGLYLRAAGGENLTGKSGYIINVIGNTIQNIKREEGFTGGINCELRGGSLVSNNIILDCTVGINLGMSYEDNHCLVTNNIIKNAVNGVITDSVCRKIEINNNSLYNIENRGIFIGETSNSSEISSKFISICGNTIITSPNYVSSEGAIYSWNTRTQKIIISNNTIINPCELEDGVSVKGVGIGFNMPNTSSFICRCTVSNNNIYRFGKGIECYILSYTNRNNGLSISYNNINDCSTGIASDSNSTDTLLVFEGNKFNNCKNSIPINWYGSSYEGSINKDGTITIRSSGIRDYSNTKYGYIVNALPCFFKKAFIVGDKVIDTTNKYFTEAILVGRTSEGITDSNTVWRVTNGKFPSTFRDFCAVEGQCIFDTTIKKPIWYTGTKWVDATGADV